MMLDGTPGTITVDDLPDSFKLALSDFALRLLVEVYNDSIGLEDDPYQALQVAWEVVKSRLVPFDDGFAVMDEEFEAPKLYTFDLDPAEEILIRNSANGDIEIDAILATTEPRTTDGKYFTVEELLQLAEQINMEGSTMPDVNHETLQMLVNKFGPDYQSIIREIRQKKGVFKNIKAVVQDGKLWIKAFLDRKFADYVNRFKGLSIEALGKTDRLGRIHNPKYLGFTFTNRPQLPGAGIAV